MLTVDTGTARIADEAQPLLSPLVTTATDVASNASSETVRIPATPELSQDGQFGTSRAKAVLIVIAMAFLIFFQAMNISILTTTQSTIAADLNAFDSVSWFTSAYLVCFPALFDVLLASCCWHV